MSNEKHRLPAASQIAMALILFPILLFVLDHVIYSAAFNLLAYDKNILQAFIGSFLWPFFLPAIGIWFYCDVVFGRRVR